MSETITTTTTAREGIQTLGTVGAEPVGWDGCEDMPEAYGHACAKLTAETLMRAGVAGHTLYGAIMGLALGRAEQIRTRKGDAAAWHVAAIAVPTALHGLYDLLLHVLSPSIAFAFALARCALGTVAAVMLVRGTLGGRESAC